MTGPKLKVIQPLILNVYIYDILLKQYATKMTLTWWFVLQQSNFNLPVEYFIFFIMPVALPTMPI